jgi:hypothetical protein
MADVLAERVRTISQAKNHRLLVNPQTGRPVDRTQVFRWITEGKLNVRGTRVQLEATRHPVGGFLVTSDEAIERFVAQLNGDAAPSTGRARLASRRGALVRARRQLDRELGPQP